MQDKDFIVNIGPNGTFVNSGNYQTLPADIDMIFDNWKNQQVTNITVFFHGGLVNETNGMETARKMAIHFKNAGSAPLCVVWETGLIETVISSNIKEIGERKLFKKVVRLAIKKMSQKLGFNSLSGRGAGSMLSDIEIETELLQPQPFSTYLTPVPFDRSRGPSAIDQLPQNEALLLSMLEAEVRPMVEQDLEFKQAIAVSDIALTDKQDAARSVLSVITVVKKIASILYRVIKRYIEQRNHDFYPTIVEEIFREFYIADLGAWIWSQMKRKSDTMWSDNTNRTGVQQYAGRYFLDRLAGFQQQQPGLTVNLVGHSAGSIAICNLLKQTAAVHPQLRFRNILFMAPACRVDLLNKELITKPERFDRLRIFTMTDANEKNDVLVPFLYTHSLLYLISGILEDQGESYDAYIAGMERHICGLYPYDSVAELQITHQYLYDNSNEKRLILSKTAEDAPVGEQTTALKHGAFDDNDVTIKSIQYLIVN